MPDKPTPEQDPITSKSYAAHYVIATIILIITLFWALWDEAWGQRPWKAFQEQFKTRYTAFLNTARTKSQDSEKDVEKDPEYAELSATVRKATQDSAAAAKAAREKLDDANARLLAVQSVFTDRRAYVNALTYELETSESASAKASKQKEIDKYKAETGDGRISRRQQEEIQLPATGRDLQRNPRRTHEAEPRTRRRAEARHRSPRQDGRVRHRSHGRSHAGADRRLEEEDIRLGSRRSSRSTWRKPTSSTAANPATWARASR